MQPFEKLGAFYLGRRYDAEQGLVTDEPLLYDAKDLTTHAVCVGMTGSGKTGLCIALLEEAAIDGIPAIAIDPKGDLGNLFLTFPDLRPSDFRPWIDDGESARKGQSPDAYATSVADLWRKGLAEWGQDGDRIRRFREAVDLALYTPGSAAGRPLQLLKSFAAPPPALRDDVDAFRDRVMAAASGLLALLGVDADPIRSREHILLSSLLHHHWTQGRDLDVASLIREIHAPPFERVGVMDLETFFPAKERFALSMGLNGLLASPGFAGWMEGEPLDVGRLLWTAEGKPRLSVLSIAHLSDAERMFFVTQLLNEVVAWMRAQSGTTSLRALLYMDEVFGYFPPTANPPSKLPMLTLLKQARAFGLGIVLATQNPVDLDYKGLSNAGTWWLGRLQTERDKQRVLEGLEGASASAGANFDRPRLERVLAGLKSRVFLMNNVHDDAPELFHTRWALSYLRGPLTRDQIRDLAAPGVTTAAPTAASIAPPPTTAAAATAERPVLPASIEERFVQPVGAPAAGRRTLYRPALLGEAKLHFVARREGIDLWRDAHALALLDDDVSRSVWDDADLLVAAPALSTAAEAEAAFSTLPAEACRAASYQSWGKALGGWFYREKTLDVWKCAELKQVSEPGETEGDFRVRLRQAAREKRDLEISGLEKKYAPKLASIRERLRKAQERVDREQSQYGQQKLQTAISVGATVIGALFGRKVTSVGNVGRATTAARGVGRAARERDDVKRAVDEVAAQQARLQELERELDERLQSVRESVDPAAVALERVAIRARKSDIVVGPVQLVWLPWHLAADGSETPAYRAE